MNEGDEPVIEVVVAAPIDVVWRALRDPEEIRRWFGWEYAELADEIAYMFVERARASEAEKVVRVGGGSDRFSLEGRGERTVVRVTRSAPPPAGSASWKDVYDDEIEGWLSFVQQLRFALEHHPGRDRQTLYLSGHGAPLPAAALGLSPAAGDLDVGARYEVSLAPGDAGSGTVWFRSPYQLGLTVEQWGPGLLIATARPPSDRSPSGGGQALLTSYGQDAAEWRALGRRWSDWWRARYERTSVAPDPEAVATGE